MSFMGVTTRQEQLDVLAEASRRMQACAEAGDWETVSHLQANIQQLAGELFSDIDNSADVEQLTEAVKQVLTINKGVAEMGAEARDSCLKELNQLQQGRAAVKKYTANTG